MSGMSYKEAMEVLRIAREEEAERYRDFLDIMSFSRNRNAMRVSKFESLCAKHAAWFPVQQSTIDAVRQAREVLADKAKCDAERAADYRAEKEAKREAERVACEAACGV